MKKVLSILKSVSLIAIAFILTAFIGQSYGFDTVTSGSVGVAGFALVKIPTSSLAAGLDLSAIVSEIELHFRKFNNVIWTNIMKGVDFEQYMRPVAGVKGEYVNTNAVRSTFLQPFQKAFTASGDITLTPYKNYVRRIKMDVLMDNLHELFDTYLAEIMVDETRTPDNYPFVRWFIDNHVIPGIQEEMNAISVKGEYVAPTPGTPGASLESTDGVFTIIANEITAGNLTNIITTGAITSSNVVDKLEQFHKDMPAEWKKIAGPIFLPEDVLEMYRYTFRDDKGVYPSIDVSNPVDRLWGTNKTLIGLPDLNGSQRIMFTPTGANGNLLKLYDSLMMPVPTFQLFERSVKILGDFHRGYGFQSLDAVFVNDQA